MKVQHITTASESYTHAGWVYRNICWGSSRLYYILDGEAYYEENGERIRLKKHHLYLTPVKKPITLYDNPSDPLLHTYTHIITAPPIRELIEVEVIEGTPLSDAVALWRKYIDSENVELLTNIIQLLLSCIEPFDVPLNAVAEQAKTYLDSTEALSLSMNDMSRALGYSREHLTRCFLSAYRITPKQYLHARKMNLAMALLLEGEKVQEVAERLGYSSPYAFSKAFKAYFGLSPRKQLEMERAEKK